MLLAPGKGAVVTLLNWAKRPFAALKVNVGFGRIVASEKEVPNMTVNLVWSG